MAVCILRAVFSDGGSEPIPGSAPAHKSFVTLQTHAGEPTTPQRLEENLLPLRGSQESTAKMPMNFVLLALHPIT